MKKNLLLGLTACALAWSPSLFGDGDESEIAWGTASLGSGNYIRDKDSECCEPEKTTLNTGFNLAVLGGANWAHTHVPMGKIDFDTGYLVGGSVGYRWEIGLEVEAEVIYRRNGLDRFTTFSNTRLSIDGHLRKWSYMGNLKYYLPVHWYVTPYFGAGAGYANQKLFIDRLNGISINSQQKKEGFAWQVLAGVTCFLCKHLDLDLDYHYLQLKGSTHDNSFSAALTASF